MGEDSCNARWATDQPTMDMGQVTVTSKTAMYFSRFVSVPFLWVETKGDLRSSM